MLAFSLKAHMPSGNKTNTCKIYFYSEEIGNEQHQLEIKFILWSEVFCLFFSPRSFSNHSKVTGIKYKFKHTRLDTFKEMFLTVEISNTKVRHI